MNLSESGFSGLKDKQDLASRKPLRKDKDYIKTGNVSYSLILLNT